MNENNTVFALNFIQIAYGTLFNYKLSLFIDKLVRDRVLVSCSDHILSECLFRALLGSCLELLSPVDAEGWTVYASRLFSSILNQSAQSARYCTVALSYFESWSTPYEPVMESLLMRRLLLGTIGRLGRCCQGGWYRRLGWGWSRPLFYRVWTWPLARSPFFYSRKLIIDIILSSKVSPNSIVTYNFET